MQSGILLLVMAMCLTPAVDVLAKQLTAEYSPFTVAFFRYFAGGLVALCVARALGKPRQTVIQRLRRAAAQGGCHHRIEREQKRQMGEMA